MPDTLPQDCAARLAPAPASAIVELRQYTMHPGRRDELIDLFESRFLQPLEAAGQRAHGQFRNAADPNQFVWLRGFADMESRPGSLAAFYDGPVWREHRNAANATMVDSDNVLLLKPVDAPGFSLTRRMTALMVATVYLLQSPVDEGFLRFYREAVRPAMVEAGAPPLAELSTLEAPNNFPRLPVREGEHAFVSIAGFDSVDEYRRHLARLEGSASWKATEAKLAARLKSPPSRIELLPTAQTQCRYGVRYAYSTAVTGDVHDFDFIAGEWSVANRRLKARGVGAAEWEAFPAKVTAHVLMGGVVNVDTVDFPTKGWAGTTFRHFDLEKRQWSIYWVNNRDGKMQSPVTGGFDGDIGLFYGEDVDEGRPVKVVYQWTRVGPNAARWRQSFSYDGGTTWETNWMMEQTRVR